MSEGMLEDMMLRQHGLMIQLEKMSGQNLTVQEAIHGVIKEAAEILDAFAPGTKPWQQEEAMEAADKEAIDVQMYLLEYFILRGYTAMDVSRMFHAKHDIVQQRLQEKVK